MISDPAPADRPAEQPATPEAQQPPTLNERLKTSSEEALRVLLAYNDKLEAERAGSCWNFFCCSSPAAGVPSDILNILKRYAEHPIGTRVDLELHKNSLKEFYNFSNSSTTYSPLAQTINLLGWIIEALKRLKKPQADPKSNLDEGRMDRTTPHIIPPPSADPDSSQRHSPLDPPKS